MAIRLCFPTVTVEKSYLHKEIDFKKGMTAEYFDMCKKEIDAMRVRDPQGRRRSNAGHGWQSNDGIDDNPIFNKLMREIKRVVSHELMPYLGAVPGTAECRLHNSWANINYTHGWNAPHLHNGCFYSGVFYIKADGDEGNIRFIDTHYKVVGNSPHMPRMREAVVLTPRTGDLFLFPSGLMHMVEPNTTNKDRYSISFNCEINERDLRIKSEQQGERENWDWLYEIDENGIVINDGTFANEEYKTQERKIRDDYPGIGKYLDNRRIRNNNS